MISPKNYSSKAFSYLKKDIKTGYYSDYPKSALVISELLKLLHTSQKFLLPDNCNLIDSSDYAESHHDLVKLPYPVCAFESGSPGTQCSKRIALAHDVHQSIVQKSPYLRRVFEKFGEGIFIHSINFQDNSWDVGFGSVFLPENDNVSRQTDDGFVIGRYPLFLLPEIASSYMDGFDKDPESALEMIAQYSNVEVSLVCQATALLNCENVGSVSLPSSKAKRLRAATKKGRSSPIYDYHILNVGNVYYLSGKQGGNTTEGVRMHLRRGHIRRLKSGKATWVKHTIVNADSDRPMLHKDYRIKP